MTDIVERLRQRGTIPDGWTRLLAGQLADEAAAEIERLRKELSYRVHTDEDIKVQNAEIERLRAALLTVPCPSGDWNGIVGTEPVLVAECLKAGVCDCIYGDVLKRGANENDGAA